MRFTHAILILCVSAPIWGETAELTVNVDLNQRLGPMNIDRMALGQGGLSEEPMWDNRIAEIRALRPKIIRLFIQQYFDLLPAPGRSRCKGRRSSAGQRAFSHSSGVAGFL